MFLISKLLGRPKVYHITKVVDASERLVEIDPHWLFQDRLGNRIIVQSKQNLKEVLDSDVQITSKKLDDFGRLVAELEIA